MSSIYITTCQIKKDSKFFGGPLYLIKKSSKCQIRKQNKERKSIFIDLFILFCKNIVFLLNRKNFTLRRFFEKSLFLDD